MKEKIRCKVCGYIMDKDALGEVCPACGVKKEMFEPYQSKIGALRQLILDSHIHPVIVHFPQAVAFLLVGLTATYPLFENMQEMFAPSIFLLSWLQPFAVVAAFLSGIFDGKVRFRKVTTPILVKKMIVASLFLIASIGLVFFPSTTFDSLEGWASYLFVTIVALGCGSYLGLLGAKLIHAAMPGDKILMGKKKKIVSQKVETSDKS